MTKKTFYKKFHGVCGPTYRGGAYPSFDPYAINESKFADELRFKEFTTDFEEAKDGVDTITISWTSQNWNDDGISSLVKEIIRCFESIGFVGNVVLHLRDRYNEHNATREFTAG